MSDWMRADNDRGFTLMEALVALIIITAMTAILYRGVSSSLRVSAVAKGAETALTVARSRLAELGTAMRLAEGRWEGRDGQVGWRMEIRPYSGNTSVASADRPDAFWTTVTVSWRDGRAGKPQSLTLTTLKMERVP